jgi:hypothetical protein
VCVVIGQRKEAVEREELTYKKETGLNGVNSYLIESF